MCVSQSRSENERVYMQGYTDALADMLEDFNAEFDVFMKNAHTFSLN